MEDGYGRRDDFGDRRGRGWHGDRGHRGHRGHRGRGGHRGQRHYGQGRREQDAGDIRDNFTETKDNRSQRGGRGGPPRGLRGREIGMWFASRSKARAKEKDREERNEVVMETHQRQHIERLLDDIKADRGEEPRTRPADPPDTDWYESRQVVRPSFEMHTEPNTSQSTRIKKEGASLDQSEQSTQMDDSEDELGLTDIVKEWSEESLMDVENEMSGIKSESNFVKKDELLDNRFLENLREKQDNPEYIKMMKFRKKLPSYDQRNEINNLINKNQVVVLSGETGCGKTTQVPQYILDEYLENGKGSECHIICTQPRRISAISVAQRVAAERAEKLGVSVGYMIRLENKLPRSRGSILYCTTGILLRYFESDPLIENASHIILDEIHERDLLSDFLIIILKDLISRRPDIKIILMSATLNAEAFSEYFNNCPMINIPGFTYPVTEYQLEDVYELLNYKLPQIMVKKERNRRFFRRASQAEIDYEEKLEPWLNDLYANKRFSENTLDALQSVDTGRVDLDLTRDLIRYIVQNKGDGAILVFVPGWAEIGDLNKKLTADRLFSSSSFRIIPLHSMMPTINQREVFERPPPGVRKIVIATNIAETSITIDDIVFVIDSGKIKVKGFSPENNLMSLQSEPVSLANSKQRRGRAGRVQAGECYHLFSSLQRLLMVDYLPPEILRTPLEELCLQIKLLKLGKIIPFVKKAMQPPSITALQSAIKNLQDLNALDKDENLLPLGKHLARMPLDPHTGKMILFGAMFGCLDPILTIAAALNFKDPFYVPLGKEKEADRAKLELADGCNSDHILLVKTFQDWLEAEQTRDRRFCNDYFLSYSTLLMLKKMRKQLEDLLSEIGFLTSKDKFAANRNADNMALVKSIVCAGLYPNVGKIMKFNTKHSKGKFKLSDGSKAELHPKSVANNVKKPGTQWMVYHKKMKTTGVYIYDCSLVSPYSLLFFGGDIKESVDDGRNTVIVDDWITFNATRNTVALVKDLRRELDAILDEKISKTHAVSWDKGTKQGALIQAIIDLVTKETEAMDYESSDD